MPTANPASGDAYSSNERRHDTSMAGEIWNQLVSGELSNAANLTDDRQAVSLVSWLCNL